MRICVAAICRNEEKNIGEWLQHVSKADAISLIDTGSTDATSEIVSRFSHPAFYHMFDVDEERNLGASRELAATPFSEDDLIVWLDIDERFDDPDWVDKLRNTDGVEDAEAVWILMRNGNSHYDQMKAYRRRSYEWRYRAHEVLISKNPQRSIVARAGFATDHFPDPSKPRDYLMELARDAGDWPRESRCSFYYARELCYAVIHHGRHELIDDAVREVERLERMNPWKDYVLHVNLELAKALFMVKRYQEAVAALYRAIAARPDRIEGYGLQSDVFYRLGDYISAISFAVQGIAAAENEPKPLLFDQTSINLDLCLENAYWGCRNSGLIEHALHYLARLSAFRNEDVNLAIQNSGLLANLMQTKQEPQQELTSNEEQSAETQGSDVSESDRQNRPDVGEDVEVVDDSEQSKPV